MKIHQNKYSRVQNQSSISSLSKVSGRSSLPKQGDLIHGEIADIQGNKVKIRLVNGQILDAKMTESFSFFIGQRLNFMVKESTLEQLLLKPMEENGQSNENKFAQILENAGLPISKTNLALVEKLIINQMPVDKKTLLKIIPFMKQSGDIDLNQLLFLLKNNLEINQANFENLSLLINDQHKILESITTLGYKVADMPLDSTKTELTNILLSDYPVDQKLINELHNIIRMSTGSELTEDHQTMEVAFKNANIPIEEIVSSTTLQSLNLELKHQLEAFGKQPINLEGKSLQEIFTIINQLDISLEEKMQLNHSIEKNITLSILSKALVMNASHLETTDKLQEYFKFLSDKLQKVLSIEELSVGKSDSVIKETTKLESSVQFMNSLNQNFNFLQMPFLLNDQLINSELYIMNRKRKSLHKNDTITALLRLDLLQLGHLDIYVMKKNNQVECKFYVEDQEKVKIIEEHAFNLYNQLGQSGFKVLGISVLIKEKEFHILKDFFEESANSSNGIKRFNFDMRV